VSPENLQEVERFWAEELGSSPEFLAKAPAFHCTQQEIYNGVQLLQRDRRVVLAAPPHQMERISKIMRTIPRAHVFSSEFLERLLTPDLENILGPAQVSYADQPMLRRNDTSGCRLLTPEDAPACEQLRNSLSTEELEQSGFNAARLPAFGKFVDGTLCAVANYEIWGTRIAHIGVVTHPQYRRQGHAAAVINALAAHAFERNLILQYRAMAINTNSLKLAEALGFEHYCSTIYARLRVM